MSKMPKLTIPGVSAGASEFHSEEFAQQIAAVTNIREPNFSVDGAMVFRDIPMPAREWSRGYEVNYELYDFSRGLYTRGMGASHGHSAESVKTFTELLSEPLARPNLMAAKAALLKHHKLES